jgi:hypothetical protein
MLRRLPSRLSTAALICVGLIMTESCAREPAPGEVMLLLSTDLSVSSGDVDTLHITVTRDGKSDTLTEQCYWLRDFPPGTTPVCPAASLPGTIALVSNEATSGRAHVHLELLRGGAKGAVLVQRDAELQIPSEGVKQLPMALDFLCLESTLPAACAPGTTCQAGSCVDDEIGQLADYVATPSANVCFDVTKCFGSINGGNSTLPQLDVDLGCSIKGNTALDAVNVNVALIVNPLAAGNFGVCDSASGKCLIPLDYGPEGWTTLTDSNGALVVGLPEALCAAGRTSISGVTIRRSGQCGVKDASLGLCSDPVSPICVAAQEICPEGASWGGFSCSGKTPPESRAQGWCGQVQADPTTGPVVPGLWCCGESTPELSNPLMIDDMSSGPLVKLQPENKDYAPGGWFTFSDDSNAVISPPPYPALFSYRVIEPAVTPAAGAAPIGHAACVRSAGFSGYVAGEGFMFQRAPPDYANAPLDVSRYTGIRFWAYSAPPKLDLPTQISVQFSNMDTYTESSESTCMRGGRATCDNFAEALTLPADGSWAPYTVKWVDLKQDGFGEHFDSFNTEVFTVGFQVLGPGSDSRALPFDFCVAQIEFTQD